MSKETIILKNLKTGQEYPVTEDVAKKILSNPQLNGTYSKSKAKIVPEEVKAMREKTVKTTEPQTVTAPEPKTDTPGSTVPKEPTERGSAGNTNK